MWYLLMMTFNAFQKVSVQVVHQGIVDSQLFLDVRPST
jgi:hypothetical protein